MAVSEVKNPARRLLHSRLVLNRIEVDRDALNEKSISTDSQENRGAVENKLKNIAPRSWVEVL